MKESAADWFGDYILSIVRFNLSEWWVSRISSPALGGGLQVGAHPPLSPTSEPQMTSWHFGIIYARSSYFPTSSEVVTPWVLTDLWCRHQRGNDPKSHLEFLRWPSFMCWLGWDCFFNSNSIFTAGGPAGAFTWSLRRLKNVDVGENFWMYNQMRTRRTI